MTFILALVCWLFLLFLGLSIGKIERPIRIFETLLLCHFARDWLNRYKNIDIGGGSVDVWHNTCYARACMERGVF
jgi:hypothetical protein